MLKLDTLADGSLTLLYVIYVANAFFPSLNFSCGRSPHSVAFGMGSPGEKWGTTLYDLQTSSGSVTNVISSFNFLKVSVPLKNFNDLYFINIISGTVTSCNEVL